MSLLNFLKKVVKIIFTPVFLGALLLSLTLWIYTTLNSEQIAYIDIPLSIKMPTDKSSETLIPKSIFVEFKGTGWQLINLMYFNTSVKCFLDLNNFKINNNQIEIGRNDFIKGLQSIVNVQALNIVPENLVIKLGEVINKKVKVIPNIKLNPAEGFIVIGDPEISPDSISIKGNEKIIKTLNHWSTELAVFDNIKSSFTVYLPLKDTLKNMVELKENIVRIDVNVQQKASLVVKSVEVKVVGGMLPSDYILLPKYVDVVISGGIEDICNVNLDEIYAFIEYSSLLKEPTGVIVPQIIVPERIKVRRTEPSFVSVVKRTNLTEIK